MAERPKPNQKSFNLQFQLPMNAKVTITGLDKPTLNLTPHTNPVDVSKHYPQESSINPDLIEDYVQKRKELGPDNEETQIAHTKLHRGIAQARLRGFEDERVLDDFENTLAETRSNYEGRRLGSEPMRIKGIREEIETEILEEWYPDEPAYEDPS